VGNECTALIVESGQAEPNSTNTRAARGQAEESTEREDTALQSEVPPVADGIHERKKKL
jgi:hypothetical protein